MICWPNFKYMLEQSNNRAIVFLSSLVTLQGIVIWNMISTPFIDIYWQFQTKTDTFQKAFYFQTMTAMVTTLSSVPRYNFLVSFKMFSGFRVLRYSYCLFFLCLLIGENTYLGCLDSVWGFLDGVWGMSGWCLRVSGRCLGWYRCYYLYEFKAVEEESLDSAIAFSSRAFS